MTQPAADVVPEIPERLGKYRIVRPLSKGGMALVFEGRRETLAGVHPKVAIKVILPDYAASSTFRELFINEARLGAAMQHQNLVQIQDFDSDGERYYLVMEYVEGLTIARMVALAARHDLRIPLVVLCEIGRQACEGLHYAHQAVDSTGRHLGLVHRDVKPSNLIVNNQGCVKILDFGISKGRLRAERAGSVKGTWGYMAPEQAFGERVGPGSDVFGLGIVLYEMAARRALFKGRGEEEIRQLLQDDHAARMATTLDPQYAPVVRVLVRALQRDPSARYRLAADFGRALSELLPDPITAREETVRFIQRISELHEREAATATTAVSRRTGAGTASSIAPAAPSRAAAWTATVVVGCLAVASTAAVVYAVTKVTEAPQEPVTMPAVASRPVPVPAIQELPASPGHHPTAPAPVEAPAEAALAPAPVEAAAPVVEQRAVARDASLPPRPVVVKPATPPPPVETAAAEQSYIAVSSVQKAEIYVDGSLLVGGGGKRPYPPGRHVLRIVHPDGRQVNKVVHLDPGKEAVFVWDFERWEWR